MSSTVNYPSPYTHKSSFKLRAKLGCSADCKLTSLPSRYDTSTESPLWNKNSNKSIGATSYIYQMKITIYIYHRFDVLHSTLALRRHNFTLQLHLIAVNSKSTTNQLLVKFGDSKGFNKSHLPAAATAWPPPVFRCRFNFSHRRSCHWKSWAWTQCYIP